MSLGPIEIIVVGFPENQFTGEIAPALANLVESGIVRIVDLVFITKDEAGDVRHGGNGLGRAGDHGGLR